MYEERMAALGKCVGSREAEYREAIERAHTKAEALREGVLCGVDSFNAAAAQAGASHLCVEVSPVRLDDKRVRAYEFELCRGRHRGVVVVKARGEFTLVGPFRKGKSEGPCRSFPFEKEEEFAQAMGDFLEAFIDEALTA